MNAHPPCTIPEVTKIVDLLEDAREKNKADIFILDDILSDLMGLCFSSNKGILKTLESKYGAVFDISKVATITNEKMPNGYPAFTEPWAESLKIRNRRRPTEPKIAANLTHFNSHSLKLESLDNKHRITYRGRIFSLNQSNSRYVRLVIQLFENPSKKYDASKIIEDTMREQYRGHKLPDAKDMRKSIKNMCSNFNKQAKEKLEIRFNILKWGENNQVFLTEEAKRRI